MNMPLEFLGNTLLSKSSYAHDLCLYVLGKEDLRDNMTPA